MKIDDLITEAEKLARKCYMLTEDPTDSGIVAYWGGEREDIVTGQIKTSHLWALQNQPL